MVPKLYPFSAAAATAATAAAMQMQQISDPPRLKCPRCDSSNTKFCYYNNYSLAQPRHFCKACNRYWTRGGTLRNVPVGGGCRKNKRNKKPQSAPMPRATARPPENCASIPAADLCSLIYGMPSTYSNKLLFPGFAEDAQLHGAIEETFQSAIEAHLFDLHQSMEEAIYPFGDSAPTDPSHLNWNQTEFSHSWPEYNLSVAPLL